MTGCPAARRGDALARDGFPWVRICGEISRRRRKFLRTAAVDARAAPVEAGCDLARASARDERSRRGCRNALPTSSGNSAPTGWLGAIVCFIRIRRARNTISPRCAASESRERELRDRLAGPNVLLNLAYSIHPPLLLEFERRIFCDLDPSEIFYWMTKLDLGQSHHHEFWTIGLNVQGDDCRLPKSSLPWRTFYPLVDTELLRVSAPAAAAEICHHRPMVLGRQCRGGRRISRSLERSTPFAPYLDLPSRVPEATWELAMNINADDPETERLRKLGWQVVSPHGSRAHRQSIDVTLPRPRRNLPRSKAST